MPDRAVVLEDLFTTALDGARLRRFVTRALGRAIADDVNWNVSDQEARFEVAQLLDRQDLIGPDLFVSLWRERVVEWPAARKAALACGFDIPPHAPRQPRTPTDHVGVRIEVPDIDRAKLPELLAAIRKLSVDDRITLEEVRPGSVILVLAAPPEVVDALIAAGPEGLTRALGMPVSEVARLPGGPKGGGDDPDGPPDTPPKPPPPTPSPGPKLLAVGGGVALLAGIAVVAWIGLGSGSSTDGPSTDGPSTDGPSTDGPSTDGPSTDGPSTDGPSTDGPSTDGPSTDGPSTDGLSTDGPSTDGPSTDASNVAPTASFAAPERVEVGVEQAFDASASTDPDGRIVAWHWTFGDGGEADTERPSYTWATAGTYAVTLTVTDDRGGTATRTATLSAYGRGTASHDGDPGHLGTNRPPVASAAVHTRVSPPTERLTLAASSRLAGAVVLDASGSSDPDGDALAFTWDFGDGSAAQSTASATLRHAYAKPGAYTATLTAKDPAGASDTATVSFEVENTAPTASFTSSPSCDEGFVAGSVVSFDASASSDDFGVTAYEWDFGDGSRDRAKTAAEQHTYTATPDPRTGLRRVTVRLRVRDGSGATSEVASQTCVVRGGGSDSIRAR